MGIVYGVPRPVASISTFLNLPKEAITSMWSSYNLLGEGWGLDLESLKNILNNSDYLVKHVGFTNADVEALFVAFDTDANSMIDALEFFCALAVCSGMDTIDKLNFVMAAYDLTSKGGLYREELLLLFRSVVCGLHKVCPTQKVVTKTFAREESDSISEQLVCGIERSAQMARFYSTYPTVYPIAELVKYTTSQVALNSWVQFFSAIPQPAAASSEANGSVNKLITTAVVRSTAVTSTAFKPSVEAFLVPFEDPPVEIAPLEEKEEEKEEEEKVEAPVEEGKEGAADEGEQAEKPASSADSEFDEDGNPIAKPAVPVPVQFELRPWMEVADLCRPDDAPPARVDPCQDVFDLSWIFGYAGSMRRSAAYTADGRIVYVASKDVVALSLRSEEGSYAQTLMSDHMYPITCFSLDALGNTLVTADAVTSAAPSAAYEGAGLGDRAKLNVWDAATGALTSSIDVIEAAGVQYVDISPLSTLLLAVFADEQKTVSVFNLATKDVIFTKRLGSDVTVLDARFAGTESIFAIATSTGLELFVDEGTSFAGNGLVRHFERKPCLYQTVGRAAAGAAVTALSRFEYADEVLAGTSAGQLLFFHGRCCVQLLALHEGPITCVHYNHEHRTVLTAGDDGKVKILKLRAQAVASTDPRRGGVRLQEARQLELLSSLDVAVNPDISRDIRTVCLHSSGVKVLLGTAANEILEVTTVEAESSIAEAAAVEGGDDTAVADAPVAAASSLGKDVNGGPVVTCHSAGTFGAAQAAVTGLARIPGGFVTGGVDGTVRTWVVAEGAQPKQLKKVATDSGIKVVAVSSVSVAVTFDGSGNENKRGSVQIFSLPDLAFLSEINVTSVAELADLKLSGDGNLLVCLQSDRKLVSYGLVEGAWSVKCRQVFSMVPLRCDLSADATVVRVLESSGKLGFYNISAEAGAEVADAAALKATTFASQTVPYSWDLKSVWAAFPRQDPADVLVFDRSAHMLLIGSAEGLMHCARIPASPTAPTRTTVLPVHCGPVSGLTFVEEGARLVTAGSSDGMIRVWRVAADAEEPEVEPVDEAAAAAPAEDEEGGKAAALPVSGVDYDSAEDEDRLDLEVDMKRHISRRKPDLDALSALLPWLPAVGVQRKQLAESPAAALPTDELELGWVYGYNARSTRGAARYSAGGSIVYPAASLCVMYDKVANKQTYIAPSCDALTCLDIHVGLNVGACGHKGAGVIVVSVWSAATGAMLQRLQCGAVGGVSALAFSPDGKFLAVACQDCAHTVLLFDWRAGVLKATCAAGEKKVLCAAFSHLSSGSYARFVTGGPGSFKFFEMKAARPLVSKVGVYGTGGKKADVLCCAALPLPLGAEAGGNEFLLGCSNGSLAVIARGDRRAASFAPAVEGGAVTAIYVHVTRAATAEDAPQYRVVVGGTGGAVKVLDMELQVLCDFNIYRALPSGVEAPFLKVGALTGIKSVCVDRSGRKILYGTACGELAEMYLDTGANVNEEGDGVMTRGHFKDELHALAAHNLRQECVTVGDDKMLRVWNLETKKTFASIELPDVGRCVCFSPNGQIIVVGLGGVVRGPAARNPRPLRGSVLFLSFLQGKLNIIHTAADAADAITHVQFTPDGSRLYAASADCNIYAYDSLNNFALDRTLKSHTQPIKCFDVSNEGSYLLSSAYNGESLLWSTDTGNPLPEVGRAAFIAELVWTNRQNSCGPDSIGVFPAYSSYSDVNSLAVSRDKKLFVTGDKAGALKLFAAPSPGLAAPYKAYSGHSIGGVSKATFTVNDKYVLSIGRDDRTMMQWTVIKAVLKDAPAAATPEAAFPLTVAAPAAPLAQPVGSFADSFLLADGAVKMEPAASFEPPSAQVIRGDARITSVAGVDTRTGFPRAFYGPSGEVVSVYNSFIASSSVDGLSQTFWEALPGHTIVAFQPSPCSRFALVATSGANGAAGALSVHSAATGSLIRRVADDIPGGVAAATMSADMTLIACVGHDTQHSLFLYQSLSTRWADEASLVYCGFVGAAPVSCVSFCFGNSTVCTAAGAQLKFWKIAGRNAHCRIGVTEDLSSYLNLSEVSAEGAAAALGVLSMAPDSSNGQEVLYSLHGCFVLRWDANGAPGAYVISTPLSSPYSCMVVKRPDTLVLTNRSESNTLGSLASLNVSLREYSFISALDSVVNKVCGAVLKGAFVSCIDHDAAASKYLLSVSNGYILELSKDTGDVTVVSAGFSSPVTHILTSPVDTDVCFTAHEDCTLRSWDMGANYRCVTGCIALSHTPNVLASNAAGDMLFVATTGGDDEGASSSVLMLSVRAVDDKARAGEQVDKSYFQTVFEVLSKLHNVGKGPVECIKVAPDGTRVACGSADGCLYLYDFLLEENFPYLGAVRVFDSLPVSAVDFSADSRFVRCFAPSRGSDSSHPVRFFDLQAPEADEESKGAARDCARELTTADELEPMVSTAFASQSSPACMTVRGVYSLEGPAERLSSLSVSPTVVAAAFTDGRIKVFRCPLYRNEETVCFESIFSESDSVMVSCVGNTVHVCSKEHGFVAQIKVSVLEREGISVTPME